MSIPGCAIGVLKPINMAKKAINHEVMIKVLNILKFQPPVFFIVRKISTP